LEIPYSKEKRLNNQNGRSTLEFRVIKIEIRIPTYFNYCIFTHKKMMDGWESNFGKVSPLDTKNYDMYMKKVMINAPLELFETDTFIVVHLLDL